MAAAGLVAAAVLLPLAWLVIRAAGAEADTLRALLWRPRNVELLVNTGLLAAGVVAGSVAVGLPLAWLVTRTTLRFRRLVTVLAVLPLAIPGYVMGYALLSLGGPAGACKELLGFAVPRLSGFWGAWLALTLYNYPYLFLTLKAAFERLDPAQAEAARSLGHGPWSVLWRVTLPSLVPALLAGSLIVGLYVVGDFGVVSLMRYDTLSYALFVSLADLRYAAWIALALVSVAGLLLVAEALVLRGSTVSRASVGAERRARLHQLPGTWSAGVWVGLATLLLLGVVVPVGTTVFWLGRGLEFFAIEELTTATWDSVRVALPAAALTVAAALPVAWLAHRSSSRAARAAERVAHLGYAIPPLALALGYVFFALRFAPGLRETLLLLLVGYAVHYLVLAAGPLRGTLHLLTPRHEEAARSLGAGPLETLRRVTLPALRGGLTAGLVLVFLATMKELPMATLLGPIGFRPLAVNAWSLANESLYADAAPYALCMLGVSAVTVGLMLRLGGERT